MSRNRQNCSTTICNNSNLTNITSVVTEFESYVDQLQTHNAHFKLIYFDGNHSKKATLDYFEKLLPTVAE